jgi:uncharacterized protein with HEPN domain
MAKKELNPSYFEYIKMYCEKIDEVLKEFDYSKEKFFENYLFSAAISFSIFQSTELITQVQKKYPEFVKEYAENLEWRQIVGMRNRIAHDYIGINLDIVWEVATTEIPVLKKFADEIIDKYKEITPDMDNDHIDDELDL